MTANREREAASVNCDALRTTTAVVNADRVRRARVWEQGYLSRRLSAMTVVNRIYMR